MQEYQYFLNSKDYEIIPPVENLSELILQKVSTFYHILTFLGNFCNIDKLSVLKQQHVLQNKHGKGCHCHFYWNKRCKTLF